jgi:hypothetical protein
MKHWNSIAPKQRLRLAAGSKNKRLLHETPRSHRAFVATRLRPAARGREAFVVGESREQPTISGSAAQRDQRLPRAKNLPRPRNSSSKLIMRGAQQDEAKRGERDRGGLSLPPDEQPQRVVPYRSPGAASPLNRQRVTMLIVIGALTIILFNVAFAVKAWRDWRATDDVVRSRDSARRVIKAIQRGRPAVFPSKTARTLLVIECAWSAALAAYLFRAALGRFHSSEPAAESLWKVVVRRFARLKLWTSWIGVVLALYFGTNLRAVHDEFEVLGDWTHFSYAMYSFLAIASIIASTGFVHFLLLPSSRSAD